MSCINCSKIKSTRKILNQLWSVEEGQSVNKSKIMTKTLPLSESWAECIKKVTEPVPSHPDLTNIKIMRKIFLILHKHVVINTIKKVNFTWMQVSTKEILEKLNPTMQMMLNSTKNLLSITMMNLKS